MKKLFISCPMRGRTEEAIKESITKMHKIAELYVGEELERIDTFFEGADKEKPLYCLGESIKRMQEADYFVGICEDFFWPGCEFEREAFVSYKGRENLIMLPSAILMPDVAAINREKRDRCSMEPVCKR